MHQVSYLAPAPVPDPAENIFTSCQIQPQSDLDARYKTEHVTEVQPHCLVIAGIQIVFKCTQFAAR